jgi:hypothetical protein
VATDALAEKAGKMGAAATAVSATAKAVQGDTKGAVTAVTGAAIDKAIGVGAGALTASAGAPEIAAPVAKAVEAVSGLGHIGDKLAGPTVDKAAAAATKVGEGISDAGSVLGADIIRQMHLPSPP